MSEKTLEPKRSQRPQISAISHSWSVHSNSANYWFKDFEETTEK